MLENTTSVSLCQNHLVVLVLQITKALTDNAQGALQQCTQPERERGRKSEALCEKQIHQCACVVYDIAVS